MNVLRKLLCKIGLHAGQWSLPGIRCESVRVCAACGKTNERVHHTWGEFAYITTEGCEQVRRCERCATTDSRTEHDWGSWRYLNWEYNSPQFHRCSRCHVTEKSVATMR
jgi:hypothetical protein